MVLMEALVHDSFPDGKWLGPASWLLTQPLVGNRVIVASEIETDDNLS
jgi:hypothetical protein